MTACCSIRKLPAIIAIAMLSMVVINAPAADTLVTTRWLAAHLGDPDMVVVDMTGGFQYQRFHIAGAVHLGYTSLVRQQRDGVSIAIPAEQFTGMLGGLGINSHTRVIIYDDMGGLHAGRLFWQLEQIGHARVAVLDGGLVQWILEGRKVVSKPGSTETVLYREAGSPGRQNIAVLADIKEAIDKGAPLLLDVRSREEYVGDLRQPRSGHVPGARWWPWKETVYFGNGFRRREADVLRQSLKKVGLTKQDEAVILYCHSGHRATQAYLVLRSLGYGNVRVYDGSIAEYALNPGLPLVRGIKVE